MLIKRESYSPSLNITMGVNTKEVFIMKIINCEMCGGQVETKAHNRKYCDECRVIINKKSCNKTYHKNKHLRVEDLDSIICNLINSEQYKTHHLTTRGFEEITNINSIAVSKLFKVDWLEVMSKYNKKEELISYVANEYLNYYLDTYNCAIEGFYSSHKYITQHLITLIGISNIKLMCGFKSSRHQHNLQGLEKNFYEIKYKVGAVPTIEEFNNNTNINISIYYKYYKTGSYRDILKNLGCTSEEIEICFQRVEELSAKRYKDYLKYNNIQLGYTDIEKEVEFKRVFDAFYNEHRVYPTRRQFDRLSKFSEKAYTKVSKMTWNEVREFYGYPTTYNKNISETECLNLISDVLNVNYQPQKTWDWLKSDKDVNLYIDGFYEYHNLCVEFDGAFHRISVDVFGGDKKLKRQRQNDKLKDELVKQYGYKMLRIDSRDKWYDEDYLIERIQELNIKIPNKQIA